MTYQVSNDGITINVSDEILAFPDKKVDRDGVIMYYELLNLKDSRNIYWREKLGESIKQSFKDVTFPTAILTDFPKGYKLYAHRKKYPLKERTDYYLYGRHKFRSPNEFFPHMLWLISNKSGQCRCKYCTGSTTTSGPTLSVDKARRQPKRQAKRRRDVDAPEAPKSKRVTRSNVGKSANNRKIDNGRKTPKKNTKKKSKPKALESKKNLPPPVLKYSIFRGGEIVWLAINEVLNDKALTECNKIFSIEYWPAIVGTVTSQGDNESYESIIYTVRPLVLHGSKNVTIDSLRPWLIRSSDNLLLSSNNRFTRSLLNVELDEASPEQTVEIYFKAIQKANEIAKIFTPMYQYEYHKMGAKKEHGVHYKAIYFGAELIYEDDIVRLLPEEPENQSSPVDDDNRNEGIKESYLQITSIYEDSKANIQITGDLYERGNLSEKGEYEWIPKNKQDEEYTIDVIDIAGRFYPMYSDITESFECELLKTFENRMLTLGEDVPPIMITPDTVTLREPDIPTLPIPTTTPTAPTITPFIPTKKQVAKRSSPLPPILTETDNTLTVEHTTSYFPSQDKTSKREGNHLEIEVERETKFEIIGDEKEITIKQTSDTKSIEKIESPVKFSDIEKKYTKRTDDIELPLIVSPDTPTFETDEEML